MSTKREGEGQIVIKSEVIGQFVTWLTGQSFNNVLLVLILGAILYGGWWGITVGVPQHLQQIQAGYRESNDQAGKRLIEIEQLHTERVKGLIEGFKSSQEANHDVIRSLLETRKIGVSKPVSSPDGD